MKETPAAQGCGRVCDLWEGVQYDGLIVRAGGRERKSGASAKTLPNPP